MMKEMTGGQMPDIVGSVECHLSDASLHRATLTILGNKAF
jgi:hypothetical protein